MNPRGNRENKEDSYISKNRDRKNLSCIVVRILLDPCIQSISQIKPIRTNCFRAGYTEGVSIDPS